MLRSAVLLSLAAGSLARVCHNITIPISISARNGDLNLANPTTEIDVTNFSLRISDQGSNYTAELLQNYTTVSGNYHIEATYCQPDAGPSKKLQVLSHGIGFDRTYWDFPYSNYNYSYVVQAVDRGYSTFAWDRLGVGESSHGSPISEIQAPLEVAALRELTMMLSSGEVPGLKCRFDKIFHVGHSFGSGLTYGLVNQDPSLSDGIALTGFSQIGNFMPFFALGGNFGPVKNIPALASKYPAGYIVAQDSIGVHTNFFAPGDFDPGVLEAAFATEQPNTPGELLTLAGVSSLPSQFRGPVLVITGERDIPFCGGNCYGTSVINGSAPNLVEVSRRSFQHASNFNATIVPGAGHGLNLQYSHTFTYKAILDYFGSHM